MKVIRKSDDQSVSEIVLRHPDTHRVYARRTPTQYWRARRDWLIQMVCIDWRPREMLVGTLMYAIHEYLDNPAWYSEGDYRIELTDREFWRLLDDVKARRAHYHDLQQACRKHANRMVAALKRDPNLRLPTHALMRV